MEPIKDHINKNELVFSLDIGTRTVIGVVAAYEDSKLRVLDCEIIEHEKRNMYDGQIHDIEGVVQVVKRVKNNLENRLGVELEQVSIAAAGRALKTNRVRIDREIDSTREIDKRLIKSLEMEAVQNAQGLLDKGANEDLRYYCVGYTVVNYYLDNNYIESLEFHRGNSIGADLLATFLPQVVIDSLYTVMSKVGLEVINITLEPIAAINVAIKKSLRLLNLVLVDIGAGTSDIAITKDGAIVAYGMASVAGDELTELIAKNYLIDFDVAEKIKINLNKNDTHTFEDIVGISHSLTTEKILDSINSGIQSLADEISNIILKYNEKSPSAVFLIGGGSQIPRLTEYIAARLEMPKERVVVRDSSIIEIVKDIPQKLQGPDSITPLGIAATAVENRYKDFIQITVNEKKVKLFNSKETRVSDALVVIGYNPRKLIPQRGEDFVYFLNGNQRRLGSEVGEPAKITVNGVPASLDYSLKNGDEVFVIESTKGGTPCPKLYDLVNFKKEVFLNQEKVNLIKSVSINGEVILSNIKINNGDRIELKQIRTISELVSEKGIDLNRFKVYLNDTEVAGEESLVSGDHIELRSVGSTVQEEKFNSLQEDKVIRLIINDKEEYIGFNKEEFNFVDIFNHIDFDLSKPQGNLVLLVNGLKAEYLQKLNDGDELEIYWQN